MGSYPSDIPYRNRLKTMAKIPESTESALQKRLSTLAAEHWPQIERIDVYVHSRFAYVSAVLTNKEVLPPC